MLIESLVVLIGYIALHVFSIIQSSRCLSSRTKKEGRYRKVRPIWITVYVCISLLPVAGTFWPDRPFKYTVMMIGNVTLGFDLYYCGFLLVFTLIQSIYIQIKKRRFEPKPPKEIWTMNLAVVMAFVLPLFAMIHAQQPVVTYWHTDISEGQETGEMRVVLLGDLHMSVNSNPKLIEKAVTLANEQDPDVILIAGDFFTSNYEGLKHPELYIEQLKKLSAKEGVYAVYGNHDVKENLFCGFAVAPVSEAYRMPEMDAFLDECGFTMLEDETTTIADGHILLVGRKDRDKVGDGTDIRKPVEELLEGIEPADKVFVLEHEPTDYNELDEEGADIVFSGHTHRGQIWPCNYFIGLFNKNGYGHKVVNGIDTFVTEGVGYFGPPQRSGTESEVMVIDIKY